MNRKELHDLNQEIETLEQQKREASETLSRVDRRLSSLYGKRAGETVDAQYCAKCGQVVVIGAEPSNPELARVWCDPCREKIRAGGGS